MADLLWWLGHATETTAEVVVRSDTDGAVTLTGPGFSDAAVTSSAVKDGIVTLSATGLLANSSYPITISHDGGGGEEIGALRTMPAIGSTYKFGWGSCNQAGAVLTAGFEIIKEGVVGFAHLGDMVYSNGSADAFGENPTDGDIDQSESNFNAYHRQSFRETGTKHIAQNTPFYYMADDHEWCGDNWDHTPTQASTNGASLGSQALADAAWLTMTPPRDYYQSGNPENADTGTAIAEKPSDYERIGLPDGSANITNSATDYPVMYCRWTIGDAEYFMLDCISYRSAIAATNDAGKTMLGANQKAWLKAQLDASSATFKVILSPKKTHNNAGWDNGDTFAYYATDVTELLDYIKANVSGNLTGVVWLSGDRHTPGIEAQSIVDGETYDHVCVCACPLSVNINDTQGTYGATTKLLQPNWGRVFGIVEVHGSSHLLLQMRDASNGNIRWQGKVLAGSNALIYDDMQVSI